MKVYFSDFFDVDLATIEGYGAFNISLINDLPLFIDPFLIFNSEKKEYQNLHEKIIEYIIFLKNHSIKNQSNIGLLKSLYCFPEIKQTWLGYSQTGNNGRGNGIDFAKSLRDNLSNIFSNSDNQSICKSIHLEKFCLIKDHIGRDCISDFVTNLIKGWLVRYTETFATKYLREDRIRSFLVSHVDFNYQTRNWERKKFVLPAFRNDYVLLTPRDLLTKDDMWINKKDLFSKFQNIVTSMPNSKLRSELNYHLLPPLLKSNKVDVDREINKLGENTKNTFSILIEKYPEILDYYVKYKEDHGNEANSISQKRVRETHDFFVKQLSLFVESLNIKTDFYKIENRTFEECYEKVQYLKDVIENKDGYRVFYLKDKPIKRESDLHILYRLIWFASPSDVTHEASGGRSSVDFKISDELDNKIPVEFKLASNPRLEQNIGNQINIYKSIKVIICLSDKEKLKIKKILKNLDISHKKYLVLVDASPESTSLFYSKSSR